MDDGNWWWLWRRNPDGSFGMTFEDVWDILAFIGVVLIALIVLFGTIVLIYMFTKRKDISKKEFAQNVTKELRSPKKIVFYLVILAILAFLPSILDVLAPIALIIRGVSLGIAASIIVGAIIVAVLHRAKK